MFLSDHQDYPCTSVIVYSKAIVARADPRIGEQAKQKIKEDCDSNTALHEILRRKYQLHIRQPETGIIASPRFIGEMRAQTLRRLAHKSHIEHERDIARLKAPPVEADPRDRHERARIYTAQIRERSLQLELAQNPNAFLHLSRFLIKVATLNDEHARDNRLIGIEQAVADANEQLAAQRKRIRPSRRPTLRIPGR